MIRRLREMTQRYDEITEQMSRPDVVGDRQAMQKLGREQRALTGPVETYLALERVDQELAEARELAEGDDPDMRELAREDLERLEPEREQLLAELSEQLRPRDPNDERDVILEIRAGEGGQEAALWAEDLLRMYARYAESRGWKLEVVSTSGTDLGGFREAVAEVRGEGAYSRLKYESGGHRVQRVPATEAQGRIHTSAATVAVMPEVDDVELDIKDDDLKIDVYRSGGHGGQSVNTTDSAVRITHLPTGEVVICQDERSQLKNKTKAMAVLRARLYERELRAQQEAQGQLRRSQVGTGERGGKIRTYNYKENRVTDHRIGLTIHNLQGVLQGNLDPLIDALVAADRSELARQD
ncbi:MAG: peptide chain release factor 1 [Chloroflexi bacterium]|nr:peptide chain release factor 1 [Chloroflexota bacterium]